MAGFRDEYCSKNSIVLQWRCPWPHLYQRGDEVQLISGGGSLGFHGSELKDFRLACISYTVFAVFAWGGLGFLLADLAIPHWMQRESVQIGNELHSWIFTHQINWLIPSECP